MLSIISYTTTNFFYDYQKFDILATQTSLTPLESIQRRHFSRARTTCCRTKSQRCPSSRRDITKALILVETVTTHIPSRLCDSTCDV